MKIVTYDEFIRMPAGTIFAPWTPSVYEGDFEIKVDGGKQFVNRYTGKEDYTFNGTMLIYPHIDTEHELDGWYNYGPVKTEMFHYDGAAVDYSDYKMFAIMEEKDIRKMIEALEWALRGCVGEFDTDIPLESEV